METRPLISSKTQISYGKQEEKDPDSSTFDDLLHEINDFGRYQIRTVLLLCLPAAFINTWQYYDLVFMLYNPEKDCQKWNLPYKDIQKSFGNLTDQCQYEGREIKNQVVHCQKWTYTNQYYENTLATQWGPCQNQILFGNIMTIFAIVNTFGDGIMSILQDILGRKLTFFIMLTLSLIGSGFSLLAPSLGAWVAIRAMQMTQQTNITYTLPLIWALEFSGPRKRTVVNFWVSSIYTIATVAIGLVAWACHNWIQLGMATVFPFIFFYTYIFLVDESPRWLLSMGKLEKATKIMEKIAKTNKKESHLQEVKLQMRVIASEKVEQEATKEKYHAFHHILDLFRHSHIRLKLFLLTVAFCSNNLIYNSMAFNAPNLGNMFIVYIVQALVGVPAAVFALLPNRIGRIPPIILAMFACGFFNLLCIPALLYAWNQWTVIIFSSLAKFFITVSFYILFQTAGELYPTSLRGTALGVNLVASDFILVIMPHILATTASAKWIPMLIMGVLSILGAVCCCFLPEPMDQPMPLLIDEADKSSQAGIGQIKNHWRNVTMRGRSEYRELQE